MALRFWLKGDFFWIIKFWLIYVWFCFKIVNALRCLWPKSMPIDQISVKNSQVSRLVAKVFFPEERADYGQPFDLAFATFIQSSTMFTYDMKFCQCFVLKGKVPVLEQQSYLSFKQVMCKGLIVQSLHLHLTVEDCMVLLISLLFWMQNAICVLVYRSLWKLLNDWIDIGLACIIWQCIQGYELHLLK